MNELEEKLGAMLKDPQLMQQVQAMAQALGMSPPADGEDVSPPSQETALDPRMLQGILSMMRQGNVDHNQETLLHALAPYLSQARVSKLERAMRTARMAGAASNFLNAGGLKLLSGR